MDVSAPIPLRQRLLERLRALWADRVVRVFACTVAAGGLAWACEYAPEGAPRLFCQAIAAALRMLGGGQ